jgi:hypothetical protein
MAPMTNGDAILTALLSMRDATEAGFGRLEGELSRLAGRFDKLEFRVGALESRLDRFEVKVLQRFDELEPQGR